MSNHSVTYSLYLNSNVRQVLQQHEADANRLDGTMQKLQNTLATIGIAMTAHRILEAGREWIQGAADYETAMLRIKNVSANTDEGLKNQLFISAEVDKFKIDLQRATDAWGDFLTMVRGSHMSGDMTRKLHDEVLMIGKVTGLGDGQMDASVRNLGKLLEQGTLEGRHLRPLSYQLSGLMPYIAKQMGLTNVELEKELSSGRLTKSATPSTVLLKAIEAYSNDLAPRLGETLESTQSQMNDLSNEWLRFKNDAILTVKPELVDFMHELRDGIVYLHEHKDAIIQIGKVLVDVGEFWIKYKITMLGVNLAFGAYQSIQKIITGTTSSHTTQISAQSLAYKSETTSVSELTVALERLNYVQNAQNGSFFTNSAGVTMANTVGNRYASSAMAAQIAQQQQAINGFVAAGTNQSLITGAIGRTALGGTLGTLSRVASAAAPVTVVGAVLLAIESVEAIAGYIKFEKEYNSADNAGKAEMAKQQVLDNLKDMHSITGKTLELLSFNHLNESKINGDKQNGMSYSVAKIAENFPEVLNDSKFIERARTIVDNYGDEHLKNLMKSYGFILEKEKAFMSDYVTNTINMFNLPSKDGSAFGFAGFPYALGFDPKSKEHEDVKYDKKDLGSNRVRGNSITNIEIKIGEMNGIKSASFSVSNKVDAKQIAEIVGVEMTKMMTEAANDAQHVIEK